MRDRSKDDKGDKSDLGSAVSQYWADFTSSSSLHGLQYMGKNKHMSLFERLWWIAMFLMSLVMCGYFINKVWIKWQETPVIVSFAETYTPIWQIPFPAVTVCSETKSRQSVFNFTDIYYLGENRTKEQEEKLEAMSLLCDFIEASGGNKTTDKKTIDFLVSVAPSLDQVLAKCSWRGNDSQTCSHLFSPILTEDGICYTFNMLSPEELLKFQAFYDGFKPGKHNAKSEGWNLENGYPKGTPLMTYPARGQGSGSKTALRLVLRDHDYDLDYLCRGPLQGFKVILHSPADMPHSNHQYFRVPFGHEVIAAIKPSMMTTAEGLKNYHPERRQCFFPLERRLKYFKVYTQMNCEQECLSNFTMTYCGCVTFSMPRDHNMPICSSSSMQCVDEAEDDLLTREVQSEILREDEEDDLYDDSEDKEELISSIHDWITEKNNVANQCNCLPSCTSISYDMEASQGSLEYGKFLDKIHVEQEEGLQLAAVTLYFKEHQFIPSKRSELYGQTDFLANCGGLLGLFLGFSLLSLIEIFYFISIRLCCHIKNCL